MKSKALVRIRAEAKAATKESFNANKYVLEKGWEPKADQKNGRGRPSKEEIKKAANEIAATENRLTADFDRILKNSGLN